jgi:HEPN domain-containing protein
MNRKLFYGVSDQGKAAVHRMEDAKSLFGSKRWRGAMYLAGYSIECLLKKKLMEAFGCRQLEELELEVQRRGMMSNDASVFTHNLELLLRMTGGRDRLRRDQSKWQTFAIVNRWVPAWRYNPDLSNHTDANDFLQAVEIIAQWIDHNI